MKIIKSFTLAVAMLACVMSLAFPAEAAPKVGDKAPDFSLKTLTGEVVRLKELTAKSNVVLIVLRGWPGYQCPLCTKLVHDYAESASGFAAAKARIVMVYPGPAEDLKAHAQEFLGNKQWPKDFIFVTDPDYSMVDAYGLRWKAPKETAFPSTLLIDKKGVIRFAKVSHSHGDRTQASDTLTELKRLPED